MTYVGKFKDTTPRICPAGLAIVSDSTMEDRLKCYPVDDAIIAVMNKAGLKKVPFTYRQPRMTNHAHMGLSSECKELLQPMLTTRYQTLLNDLRETVSDNYWNQELGKSRDPIGGLPANIAPDFTFGLPTKSDITAASLLNPPVSRYEILYNDQEFHEIYKKSHNSYFPGERICRNYSAAFDKDKALGRLYCYDPSGMGAKICMRTLNVEPVTTKNKVQANFIARTHFKISKCLSPNDNIKCVPIGHRFGKKTERPAHSMKELLEPDIKFSLNRRDYLLALQHLHETRAFCKKHAVDFQKLLDQSLTYDKETTGWLPFSQIYDIFSYNRITFDHVQILSLAALFGFFKDNQVNYRAFIDLFNVNWPIPSTELVKDELPDCDSRYLTTSQASRLDYQKIDNSKFRPAGLPSRRFDSDWVKPLQPGCLADIGSLSEETTMESLINPNIFTNYGITLLDFLKKQKPEYIRKLFEKLGYQFPNDTFEKLWQIGMEVDGDKLVCIETFRRILDQAAPIEILPQSEVTCDENMFYKRCEY